MFRYIMHYHRKFAGLFKDKMRHFRRLLLVMDAESHLAEKCEGQCNRESQRGFEQVRVHAKQQCIRTVST